MLVFFCWIKVGEVGSVLWSHPNYVRIQRICEIHIAIEIFHDSFGVAVRQNVAVAV